MATQQNAYTGNLGKKISSLALDVNQNVHAKETLERYKAREEEKNKALSDFKTTYENKTTPTRDDEAYKDALRNLRQKIVNLQLSITTTLAPAMKYLYRDDEDKWKEERKKLEQEKALLENELSEVNYLMREHNIDQPATSGEAVTAATTRIKNAISYVEEAFLSKFRQNDGDVYCTQKELTYYEIGPNGKARKVTCDFQLSAEQMDRAIERWNAAHPNDTIGPRKNNFLTTGWKVVTGSENKRNEFMRTMREIHAEDEQKKNAPQVTQTNATPAATPAPAATSTTPAPAPQKTAAPTPAPQNTAEPTVTEKKPTAGANPTPSNEDDLNPAKPDGTVTGSKGVEELQTPDNEHSINAGN